MKNVEENYCGSHDSAVFILEWEVVLCELNAHHRLTNCISSRLQVNFELHISIRFI